MIGNLFDIDDDAAGNIADFRTGCLPGVAWVASIWSVVLTP